MFPTGFSGAEIHWIRSKIYPSQDGSVGSISVWYRGGPGFKSWQGREFFNENNKYPQVRKTGVDAVHENCPQRSNIRQEFGHQTFVYILHITILVSLKGCISRPAIWCTNTQIPYHDTALKILLV